MKIYIRTAFGKQIIIYTKHVHSLSVNLIKHLKLLIVIQGIHKHALFIELNVT